MKGLITTTVIAMAVAAYGCTEEEVKLLGACSKGDIKVVKAMLDKDRGLANARCEGWTPLLAAAYNNQTEISKLLLEAKADASAKEETIGETSLHLAACYGYKEIAMLLLANGTPVDCLDDWGLTPLQRAAEKGQTRVAGILLDHKADINARGGGGWDIGKDGAKIKPTEIGWTPLHWAAQNNNLGVVRVLLRRGADARIKDKEGRTALQLALKYGYNETADAIMGKHIARSKP